MAGADLDKLRRVLDYVPSETMNTWTDRTYYEALNHRLNRDVVVQEVRAPAPKPGRPRDEALLVVSPEEWDAAKSSLADKRAQEAELERTHGELLELRARQLELEEELEALRLRAGPAPIEEKPVAAPEPAPAPEPIPEPEVTFEEVKEPPAEPEVSFEEVKEEPPAEPEPPLEEVPPAPVEEPSPGVAFEEVQEEMETPAEPLPVTVESEAVPAEPEMATEQDLTASGWEVVDEEAPMRARPEPEPEFIPARLPPRNAAPFAWRARHPTSPGAWVAPRPVASPQKPVAEVARAKPSKRRAHLERLHHQMSRSEDELVRVEEELSRLEQREKELETITGRGPYRVKGYTLYRRQVGTGKRARNSYFFSKKIPKSGRPSPRPGGYTVEMSSKSGLPFLKKSGATRARARAAKRRSRRR